MFHQQDHLKSQLQDGPPPSRQLFHCQECGKQYNTQLGYRRHVVAAHGGGAAVPCPEGAPSLLEHLGSHIDRPPPSEVGANAAVPVRERKYSCERCDRRFYTRKDVRRHAVVHTGRRDFLCPRCAQRFGRRDHLTRHLKKSHAQEAGLMPPCTPMAAAAPAPAPQCPVKEEPSPVNADISAVPKDTMDTYSRDMYNSYPMANPVPGLGPPHGLMQGSLPPSMSVGRHMTPQSHHHHLQPPGTPQQPPRRSPTATVKCWVKGGGQRRPPPAVRSPAIASAELSCTTNMDLGPLLGFLPFSLPPYSPHMGMGGLVMSYPPATTSSSSPSPSTGLSSQPPGPFPFFQPPQAHVAQGPGGHNHSQLPQSYNSPAMSSSSALPHYYQAFQQ
ncbi:hypothetical protein D4764_08G0012260 [Takifugu flavidus]|uniref:C2H2-type domain-containing protein n=1 Tax=Takifugu flavidus TaxID=433684 RepID=A0A5C6MR05_9TELE|nr:hypothetical protein D4764_08G0012260 [Takifugu flavidus]